MVWKEQSKWSLPNHIRLDYISQTNYQSKPQQGLFGLSKTNKRGKKRRERRQFGNGHGVVENNMNILIMQSSRERER